MCASVLQIFFLSLSFSYIVFFLFVFFFIPLFFINFFINLFIVVSILRFLRIVLFCFHCFLFVFSFIQSLLILFLNRKSFLIVYIFHCFFLKFLMHPFLSVLYNSVMTCSLVGCPTTRFSLPFFSPLSLVKINVKTCLIFVSQCPTSWINVSELSKSTIQTMI